jgi:hypothetical protein
LSAAADDDAVALGAGLLDDLLRNLHHLFGVENGVVAEFESSRQRRAAHGLLIQAAEP